ncbi:MAG: hypothetical protein PHZ03_02755 [Syntrophomonas sp.]|nr:hypothetical protein [Syntrophomonas sp.]
MRADAVEDLLQRSSAAWGTVEKLLGEEKLVEVDFGGHSFYMRKLYPRYKR